jgi:hypothetical protein
MNAAHWARVQLAVLVSSAASLITTARPVPSGVVTGTGTGRNMQTLGDQSRRELITEEAQDPRAALILKPRQFFIEHCQHPRTDFSRHFNKVNGSRDQFSLNDRQQVINPLVPLTQDARELNPPRRLIAPEHVDIIRSVVTPPTAIAAHILNQQWNLRVFGRRPQFARFDARATPKHPAFKRLHRPPWNHTQDKLGIGPRTPGCIGPWNGNHRPQSNSRLQHRARWKVPGTTHFRTYESPSTFGKFDDTLCVIGSSGSDTPVYPVKPVPVCLCRPPP